MYFISRHTLTLFFCLLFQYFLQNKTLASTIENDFISDGELNKFDEKNKYILDRYPGMKENIGIGPKNASSIESLIEDLDLMQDTTQNEATLSEHGIRTSQTSDDDQTPSKMNPTDFKSQHTLVTTFNNLRQLLIPSNKMLHENDLKFTEEQQYTLCKLIKIYIKKCLRLDSIPYTNQQNVLSRANVLDCVRQPGFILLNKSPGKMLRNCDNLVRQAQTPWIKRQSDVKTVDKTKKLPFHSWGGKRTNPIAIGTEKVQASRIPFNAWGGKRKFEENDNYYSDFENNDDFKRSNKVKFHSWGG